MDSNWHRCCIGVEHDPQNGKLHGYCVTCGTPWPCSVEDERLALMRNASTGGLDRAIKSLSGPFDGTEGLCSFTLAWAIAQCRDLLGAKAQEPSA